MKVRNFIAADAVAQGAQKKTYIHGAGVTLITAPEFPYAHPRLGVFLTLVREGTEAASQVVVALRDDDGTELARLAESEIPAHEGAGEDDPATLVLILGDAVGLPFEQAGRYWIVLSIGDDDLDRMVLDVVEGPPGITA